MKTGDLALKLHLLFAVKSHSVLSSVVSMCVHLEHCPATLTNFKQIAPVSFLVPVRLICYRSDINQLSVWWPISRLWRLGWQYSVRWKRGQLWTITAWQQFTSAISNTASPPSRKLACSWHTHSLVINFCSLSTVMCWYKEHQNNEVSSLWSMFVM